MYHCRTSPEKGLLTIHLSGWLPWWCSWNAPWFLTDREGSHSSISGQGFPPPLTDQRPKPVRLLLSAMNASVSCSLKVKPSLVPWTAARSWQWQQQRRAQHILLPCWERLPREECPLPGANRAVTAAFSQNSLCSRLPRASPCQRELRAWALQQQLWEWWEAVLMLSVEKCGKSSLYRRESVAEEVESLCPNLNPLH